MADRWPTHFGGRAEPGATVAVVAAMMTFATLLLVQRSKYARPVLLFAMATTAMSGLLINKLTEPNVTAPLWPVIVNLATVAAIALYSDLPVRHCI
jgi:phosphatidylserine synthase